MNGFKKFTLLLRWLNKEQKVGQKVLAEYLDLSMPTISSICNGKYHFPSEGNGKLHSGNIPHYIGELVKYSKYDANEFDAYVATPEVKKFLETLSIPNTQPKHHAKTYASSQEFSDRIISELIKEVESIIRFQNTFMPIWGSIASSLSKKCLSLREEQEKIPKIEIALLNPYSPIATQRTQDIGYGSQNFLNASDEIEKNLKSIHKLRNDLKKAGVSISIKLSLYSHLPNVALYASEKVAYLSIFTLNQSAHHTPCLAFDPQAQDPFYENCLRDFEERMKNGFQWDFDKDYEEMLRALQKDATS